MMKSFSRRTFRWSTLSTVFVALTLALLVNYQPFMRANSAHAAASPQTDWKPVPMVSQEALDAGFSPGGEGGQWIRSIKWSPADDKFLMMGTDVGGIYRSIDGGDHWQVTMVGWNGRGGNTFAFDPHNGNRVIGVGSNGTDTDGGHKPGGLYLSTDKAASWHQVLPSSDSNDNRDSVAFDPSSYDSNLGYTTVAYYVSRSNGIYKTTDGGEHWNQIQTGYSGLRVAVHPTKGYVYLTSDQNPDYGTKYGFYKSTNGGSSFDYKGGGYTYGLSVSAAAPDKVWISRYDQVLVSDDAGENFHSTGNNGLAACCNQPWQNVTVSPADANYLAVWVDLGNYNWVRYYSTDGGQNWGASDYDNNVDGNFRKVHYNLAPYNVRDGRWAYSPTDARTVFSTGGDWITKSTDGGAHYIYHGNGYNAVFVGTIQFNPNNTDDMVIATKDYNSYVTTNGGKTFTYAETGFDFGGYSFAGFALDDKVMWVGDIPNIDSSGNPLLKVSTDGGKSWTKPQYNGKDITLNDSFSLVSSGDPTNTDIGFIGNWRTTDHASSWSPMTGVDQVITYNPTGDHELYGKHGKDIVKSTDHGASWTTVVTAPDDFRELAFDQVHNRFWIATGGDVKKYEGGQWSTASIPQDQYGTTRANAVAVDPGNPDIVYVGNNRDLWTATNSVLRSTDGGANWENLTVSTPLQNGSVSGGPHEAWWISVNPRTHEAWVATNCFGVWKIASPDGSGSIDTGKQLFFDDYESGNANQWSVTSGSWGVCKIGNNSQEYCSKDSSENISLAGDTSWKDYSVQAYVVPDSTNGAQGIELLGRVQDSNHFYQGELKDGNHWAIWKNDGGSWSEVASGNFNTSAGSYYLIKFTLKGSALSLAYSTDFGSSWSNLGGGSDSRFSSGKIGLRTWNTTGRFDQVKVLTV